MTDLLAFLAGATVGVVLDVLIRRFGRDKLLLRVLRPLRDRASAEDRVLRELEEDPFFGRDYARPVVPRRSRPGDTPALTP